jgi:cell shape-determining protein MreC
MSQKPETRKPQGWLAEIRSFVFTLVVVAVGIAFVAALFNGGIGGAEQLLGSIIQWFFTLVENVIEAVRGLAAGAQQ